LLSEGCVGIFGTNECGTVGVGNAIAEAGGKVVGVGFDKSDAVLLHIKNSNLLCKMAQKSFDTGVSVVVKNTK
jgi:ribose transport system substrate-binding protein